MRGIRFLFILLLFGQISYAQEFGLTTTPIHDKAFGYKNVSKLVSVNDEDLYYINYSPGMVYIEKFDTDLNSKGYKWTEWADPVGILGQYTFNNNLYLTYTSGSYTSKNGTELFMGKVNPNTMEIVESKSLGFVPGKATGFHASRETRTYSVQSENKKYTLMAVRSYKEKTVILDLFLFDNTASPLWHKSVDTEIESSFTLGPYISVSNEGNIVLDMEFKNRKVDYNHYIVHKMFFLDTNGNIKSLDFNSEELYMLLATQTWLQNGQLMLTALYDGDLRVMLVDPVQAKIVDRKIVQIDKSMLERSVYSKNADFWYNKMLDIPLSVKQDSEGNFYIMGQQSQRIINSEGSVAFSFSVLIVKLDKNLDNIWQRVIPKSIITKPEFFNFIRVDAVLHNDNYSVLFNYSVHVIDTVDYTFPGNKYNEQDFGNVLAPDSDYKYFSFNSADLIIAKVSADGNFTFQTIIPDTNEGVNTKYSLINTLVMKGDKLFFISEPLGLQSKVLDKYLTEKEIHYIYLN